MTFLASVHRVRLLVSGRPCGSLPVKALRKNVWMSVARFCSQVTRVGAEAAWLRSWTQTPRGRWAWEEGARVAGDRLSGALLHVVH